MYTLEIVLEPIRVGGGTLKQYSVPRVILKKEKEKRYKDPFIIRALEHPCEKLVHGGTKSACVLYEKKKKKREEISLVKVQYN